MNKALKIVDVEENAIAFNQTTTSMPKNLDAEEIRAKIKAARLEKLMARQLETELTFDLEDQVNLSFDENTIQTDTVAPIEKVEESVSEPYIEAPELATFTKPASKSKNYSAGSSKRMRNIITTKDSCQQMVAQIHSGSDLLSNLNDQTNVLVNQLNIMEQEFAQFEEAEKKASKIAAEYKLVTAEYEEALDLIEKQNRQLTVLDNQRANSNLNYEKTKNELDKLQRQYQKEMDSFSESQMINSELEQENKSLLKKVDASAININELESELQRTNNNLKQKDMEAARAIAELASTKEKLTNIEETALTTTNELELLSKEFTEKEIKLQSIGSQLASTNDRLSTSESLLNSTQKEMQTLVADMHEQDMNNAKLTSDYTSLHKSYNKVTTSLENIQTKYDELNKSALEQQSQQYARIHELESVLRDANRKLELQTKSNAEISVELEATNNLLTLHEDMVAALSPKDK